MTNLAHSGSIIIGQRYGTFLLGTTLHQQVRASPHSVSLFLNLAAGDTLEWYLGLGSSITMTIGGGNSNSGNTTFKAINFHKSLASGEKIKF